jgi:hypothetical protein
MVSVCRLAPRRLGLLDLAFVRAFACYTWAEEKELEIQRFQYLFSFAVTIFYNALGTEFSPANLEVLWNLWQVL